MKSAIKFIIIGCYVLLMSACHLEESKEMEQVESKTDLLQWQDQKYAMFIHWGIYSIPAGVWNGKEISGYSEQIKGHARINTKDYRKLASQFNPHKWNADSVAQLAKESGMKSIIITSKHHDGFCMFDSEFTEFDIMDATPYKRDIIKELAAACEKNGLNFGVYFSLIDWDYQEALPFTSVRNSDSIPPLHHQYNLNQIRELLTHYGAISEFWFDMGSPTYAQSKEMVDLIKSIQPNCLVSGRIWNDQGDFVVMGDNYKPDFKMGVPWQTPASMFNETWSYRSWQERPSIEDKINEKIIDLINIVSAGGNYLLNIGPKANGEIIPFEREVLAGIGDWLNKNGESIYGAKASVIAQQDWGYITTIDKKIYLHIPSMPKNNKVIIEGLNTRMSKAYPLADDEVLLETTLNTKGLELDLENLRKKDIYATVVVLEYQDDHLSYTHPKELIWHEEGAYVLTIDNAEKFHSYSGHDYYSSIPTIVKLKWYLPAITKASCQIDMVCSEAFHQALKLSINGEEYRLPIQSQENDSKKHFIHETLSHGKFYADQNNVIELYIDDNSNPHKGLAIEKIEMMIK